MPEKILRTEYSEEMQKSYLDYSMSVITGRAVPDIRDGLKPVQRRLLYDMSDLNVHHDKKEMKSARITGDCMGRFHPHGDSSIYETMVVMSQDFKRSMPLVDGKGNFGSIEGDSAAAYRYTEAKLKAFTDEVFLKDIDISVPFVPAYTNTEKEPEVLPVRIPNFLLNGSEGIAVGMTTSTPCHNLTELCRLCIAYMEDPGMSLEEMLRIMPGPDFPTGGMITNGSELKSVYETGTGKLRLRGTTRFLPGEAKGAKDRLEVTEIPYTMIGSGIGKFMQDTADLVEARKLPEITDIANASDAAGISIVMDLRKGSDIERVRNVLYKKTRLEDTFGVNMLAISKGRPEVMGLRAVLAAWHEFQHEILERKYRALLQKAEERKEIEEGLVAAATIIDIVIAVIRGAKNRRDAENCLTTGDTSNIVFRDESVRPMAAELKFTPRQARAILEMQLYRLIGLELDELRKSYRALLRKIREYKEILENPSKRDELIKKDLAEIIEKYGCERKTVITDIEAAPEAEEPVEAAECVFTMDRFGYVKLSDRAAFERYAGGAGIAGAGSAAGGTGASGNAVAGTLSENMAAGDTSAGDTAAGATGGTTAAPGTGDRKAVLRLMSDDRVLIFTDTGSLHTLKCSDIPMKKPKDKGVPLDNISKFETAKEEVVAVFSKADLMGGATSAANLIFVTEQGLVKRVDAAEFETNQKLVAATKLEAGDRVLEVIETREIGLMTIALWTRSGYALRFALDDVPLLKKASRGVRGIKLKKNDCVAGAVIVVPGVKAEIGGRKVCLSALRTGTRGGAGSKQR